MDRKKLLLHSTLLVLFIFFINLVALKFYWYYSVWYFDMIMHFLGGFWLGLLFLWILKIQNVSINSILKIILSVFIVGFSWEIFEIIVNNFFAQNPFSFFDTISDLCFDLAGGIFSFFYFYKKIMINPKNTL
ncbi:MAG: hypothetical protein WC662_01690 [Candidatus Paceibacterota bacterium]